MPRIIPGTNANLGDEADTGVKADPGVKANPGANKTYLDATRSKNRSSAKNKKPLQVPKSSPC